MDGGIVVIDNFKELIVIGEELGNGTYGVNS